MALSDADRERVSVQYTSDDGNVYTIVTTRNHAEAMGMVASGGQAEYPRRWTTRCIHAKSADGKKIRLTCPLPDSPEFLLPAGSITVSGLDDFVVTGASGEDRPHGAPPLS